MPLRNNRKIKKRLKARKIIKLHNNIFSIKTLHIPFFPSWTYSGSTRTTPSKNKKNVQVSPEWKESLISEYSSLLGTLSINSF